MNIHEKSRYHEVHARSLADPEGFWRDAAREIDWIEPAKKIFDPAMGVYGRWFAGAVVSYVLSRWAWERKGKPDVLLLATGSEVSLCLQAYEQLKTAGVKARVVSMPSWELFDDQPQDYRDRVLPPEVTARVSVEYASRFGWAKYVGANGHSIGMRSFGASAPLKDLAKKFGFSSEAIVAAAREQLGRR